MISALFTRLVPLVTAAYTVTEGEAIMEDILVVVREIRTEIELRGVATVVALDMAEDQKIPIDTFQDYLREKLIARDRDPSLDFWGNPYAIVDLDGTWLVYSYGADGESGTEDDIDRKVDLSF